MQKNTSICILVGVLASISSSVAIAEKAEKADTIKLNAPTGWTGERIALPPRFAPDMKLKGIEEIRFAPGMFKAESDSFFSYVLVFQVEPKPALTKEVLHRELLEYYRGLAAAVLKGRSVKVDPKKFSLMLTASETAKDAKRPNGLNSFRGELTWIEPFVTWKQQSLFFEIEVWRDAAAKQNYLLVLASPKATTEPIWEAMRKIRKSFHEGL